MRNISCVKVGGNHKKITEVGSKRKKMSKSLLNAFAIGILAVLCQGAQGSQAPSRGKTSGMVPRDSSPIVHEFARTLEAPIVLEGAQLTQEQVKEKDIEVQVLMDQFIRVFDLDAHQIEFARPILSAALTFISAGRTGYATPLTAEYLRPRVMLRACLDSDLFPEGSPLMKFIGLFDPAPTGVPPLVVLAKVQGFTVEKFMRYMQETEEIIRLLTFPLPRPIDRLHPPKATGRLAQELSANLAWLRKRAKAPLNFLGKHIDPSSRQEMQVAGKGGLEDIFTAEIAKAKQDAFKFIAESSATLNPLLEVSDTKGRLEELERLISPDDATPPPLSAVRKAFAGYVNFYQYPGPSTSQFNALQLFVGIRSLANQEDFHPDDTVEVQVADLFKKIGITPEDSVEVIQDKLDQATDEQLEPFISREAGFRHPGGDKEVERRLAELRRSTSPETQNYMYFNPTEVTQLADPVTRRRFLEQRELLGKHLAKPGMPTYEQAEDARQRAKDAAEDPNQEEEEGGDE
jgi:hypothetical protein